MSTAYSLIRRALRLCRVIDPSEALPAAEADDGLESLNAMLGSWRLEGLMAYDIQRVEFALVAGTQDYSVGPGGTWNTTPTFGAQTPRPPKIEAMGLLDTSQEPDLEVPMAALSSVDYRALSLKGLTSSWPTDFHYSASVPLGNVFLWPSPTEVMGVAVYLWHGLTNWATVQTDLALPDGYARAIAYNLAVELAPEFGIATAPEVALIATQSKALVMRTNREPVVLGLDPLCPGQGTLGGWNYLTGEPT